MLSYRLSCPTTVIKDLADKAMLRSTALAAVCVIGLAIPATAGNVRQGDRAGQRPLRRGLQSRRRGYDRVPVYRYRQDAAPGATEIAGREAIQTMWQSWIDDGLEDL